jgi:IPT/TIG domain-containing protein
MKQIMREHKYRSMSNRLEFVLTQIFPAVSLFLFHSILLSAQTTPATIRVANIAVPPGGGGQIQVLLTSPRPILTGMMMMDFGAGAFDSIDGIALFSPTGDVSGAAVVNGNTVTARFFSPAGNFGTSLDYPLMTIAFTVPENATPGARIPLNLDPSSLLLNLLGATPLEFKPGTLTIGGSLSIKNVVPGGGMLPAGTVVTIYGTGFTPKTKFRLKEVPASMQFVSASEIQFTLQAPVAMDGQMIQLENPDKSTATYYSYLRGRPVGHSSHALLAATVPLFSTKTFGHAILPPMLVPQLNSDYLAGVALQNPNQEAVDIHLEQFDNSNQPMGSTTVTLQSGTRIVREIGEFIGVKAQFGSYLSVTANKPVQILGLVVNLKTDVVLPINVVAAN